MYNLPKEIQKIIYSYYNTYHIKYKICVNHIFEATINLKYYYNKIDYYLNHKTYKQDTFNNYKTNFNFAMNISKLKII